MSIENEGSGDEFPSILPDYFTEGLGGLKLVYEQSPSIQTNLQYLSERSGVEPCEIFSRLAHLMVDIESPSNLKRGIYKNEGAYSRKIDSMDHDFDYDLPLNSEIAANNQDIPRMACYFDSESYRDLSLAALNRELPIADVVRRGMRMTLSVMVDIVRNDSEYFLWDIHQNEEFYIDEYGQITEAGDRYAIDASFFHASPNDSEIEM